MMKETIKKELVGKVVSATNNKTITVLVETYKTHPLYPNLFFLQKQRQIDFYQQQTFLLSLSIC